MSYIKNAYKYPCITDLINNGGGLNIGYTYQLGVVAIAFDEGGTQEQDIGVVEPGD